MEVRVVEGRTGADKSILQVYFERGWLPTFGFPEVVPKIQSKQEPKYLGDDIQQALYVCDCNKYNVQRVIAEGSNLVVAAFAPRD